MTHEEAERVRRLLVDAASDDMLGGLPAAHLMVFNVWFAGDGTARMVTVDFEGAKPERKAHAGDRRGRRA